MSFNSMMLGLGLMVALSPWPCKDVLLGLVVLLGLMAVLLGLVVVFGLMWQLS